MMKRRFLRAYENRRLLFAGFEGLKANVGVRLRNSFRVQGAHTAKAEMSKATKWNILLALRWGAFSLPSLGIAACLPSFEERPWLIEEPRILAIRSVPAEQRPGQPVAMEALIASPDGISSRSVAWDFCLRPRTAVERASVSSSCLEGKDLQPIMPTVAILEDACARFGPNPPPVEGDEAGQRPADPDPSGGYFLPVRASLLTEQSEAKVFSFGQIRIRCDLAGATREIFDAFQARYRENQNPEILNLGVGMEVESNRLRRHLGSVSGDISTGIPKRRHDFHHRGIGRDEDHNGEHIAYRFGERSGGEDLNFVVPSGAEIELVAEIEITSFESYVVYRPDLGQLVEEQETLRLAWYVSAGELERGEQTLQVDGRSPFPSNVTNRWQSPQDRQVVHIWLVLRDSRGGSAWVEGRISVE